MTSYLDYFNNGDQPRKKKSKKSGYVIVNGRAYPKGGSTPRRKRSRSNDDYTDYGGGGSLLSFGGGGGGRKQSRQPGLYDYGVTAYHTGKSIYNSPVANYAKRKIGQVRQNRRVEKEGRNIALMGMIRPTYPNGRKSIGLGLTRKVKSNKHQMKMADIFGNH